MRKFIIFVLFMIVMAGVGYAQETLPEVRRFLENYIKDSTAEWGPLDARKSGYISDSIQIKDLRVGRVLEVYQYRHVFLDAYPDTVPFSEIIEPSGYWLVLITAHNKPLYDLVIDNSKEIPEFTGMTNLGSDPMWGILLNAYPESTKINPVIFLPYGVFHYSNRFFYFPQKGPRKIYYIKNDHKYSNDPLRLLFSGSIDTLDDSKKLIEHWKKQGINEIGAYIREVERRRAMDAKNGGKK